MGYTITVGEYYEEKDSDDYIIRDAKDVTLDSAPAFGEPTDFTNSRWPSYIAWSEFNKFIGLPVERTISQHPGITRVTPELQNDVNVCMERLLKAYPDAIAKMGETARDCDAHLARLTWLKFWIDWSLENCKKPVIANS